MSLRICRHCRKDVSLSTSTCPHCKGKLHPTSFKIAMICMVLALVLAYGALGYSYTAYKKAYSTAFCDQSAVIDGSSETCAAVCQDFCVSKGANSGFGLDRVSVQCECTCSGCFG
jgi:hypothetical protein